MFEFLEHEIRSIKTLGFHLVDGPAEGKLKGAVLHSSLPLAPSYREFVLKFGNAKLYRLSQYGYRVGVFAGPRKATLKDGEDVYHLGFHDGASVYVKPGSSGNAFSIFEFESTTEEMVANDFEEWLTDSCAHARSMYSQEEWAEILSGPEPFTAEEEEIVEARRRIQWRIIGIDPLGNHIFEVTNAGGRILPLFTVGARSMNGRLNGIVTLKIGKVGPGQTATLHVNCYKDLVPSQEIEIFSLPDPRPENRDQYGEFEVNRYDPGT